MDAVLQKSMDMTVELTASGKSGRQGCTVATLRADRVSSIPVDHDNKNNNSVVLAGSYLISTHLTNSLSLEPGIFFHRSSNVFIYEIDETLENLNFSIKCRHKRNMFSFFS